MFFSFFSNGNGEGGKFQIFQVSYFTIFGNQERKPELEKLMFHWMSHMSFTTDLADKIFSFEGHQKRREKIRFQIWQVSYFANYNGKGARIKKRSRQM